MINKEKNKTKAELIRSAKEVILAMIKKATNDLNPVLILILGGLTIWLKSGYGLIITLLLIIIELVKICNTKKAC